MTKKIISLHKIKPYITYVFRFSDEPRLAVVDEEYSRQIYSDWGMEYTGGSTVPWLGLPGIIINERTHRIAGVWYDLVSPEQAKTFVNRCHSPFIRFVDFTQMKSEATYAQLSGHGVLEVMWGVKEGCVARGDCLTGDVWINASQSKGETIGLELASLSPYGQTMLFPTQPLVKTQIILNHPHMIPS